MRRLWIGLLVIGGLLAACGSPTPSPIPASATPAASATLPPQPTVDPFFASRGGGEPRSAGYWLLWNACAPDNMADVAAANGGREAGWILMDDLLADPGILVGRLAVETCEQGLALLRAQDTTGQEKPGNAAYGLASQLMAAQLNLAAGTELCPAVDEAVQAAQLLLLSLEFDGSGDYLGPDAAVDDRELALFLVDQVQAYNAGTLCLP
jgi:hypothetical protein